jgi:4-hydroxybenzoate polyprenyltransferase
VFTPEQRAIAAQQRLNGLGWLKHLPEKWIPYAELMRLEKPVGTWLLFIPCTWSILFAASQTGAPISLTASTLALFGFGAIVMRGFGCTVNDLLDKDLDNKVIRTIERPITSGRVTVPQAKKFMALQLGIGLGVLLSLPVDCFLLGSLSLLPVCTYPLFKRFTYYPQAALSTAFNWGALLGFPAMGLIDPITMGALYVSTFCWTMTYDTIYAHQDKEFDINAGIKSTALAWGNRSKTIFTGLTTVQMATLAIAGLHSGLIYGPGFALGSAMLGISLFRMIKKVDLNDPKNCWYYFLANIRYGLLLTFGLAVDYLFWW